MKKKANMSSSVTPSPQTREMFSKRRIVRTNFWSSFCRYSSVSEAKCVFKLDKWTPKQHNRFLEDLL